MPFEEAMAELLLAEHLERTVGRGAARHLAVAEELFTGLGAAPFEARCARCVRAPVRPAGQRHRAALTTPGAAASAGGASPQLRLTTISRTAARRSTVPLASAAARIRW